VKKLICKALACTDWKVRRGEDNEDGEGNGMSTLIIDELDEENEMDDDDDKCGEEEGSNTGLFAMMKRGQRTASLLVGKPEVGTLALRHGWSDCNGMEELKELISSDKPFAMSSA